MSSSWLRLITPLTSNGNLPWTGDATQLVEHTRPSFAVLVKRRNPLIAAADANHTAAAELLAQVDTRLSATLTRALNRKTQAAYETRDVSATDAAACIRQATTLLEAARARVRPT